MRYVLEFLYYQNDKVDSMISFVGFLLGMSVIFATLKEFMMNESCGESRKGEDGYKMKFKNVFILLAMFLLFLTLKMVLPTKEYLLLLMQRI